MAIPTVALLVDVAVPLAQNNLDPAASFAHELVGALHQSEVATGGIHFTLVAAKGSQQAMPLISLSREGLSSQESGAEWQLVQEAMYTKLVLSGMLNSYDLIHCMAPIISPLLLLEQMGAKVIQTATAPKGHPASELLPQLGGNRIHQVKIGPYAPNGEVKAIPPSVDLIQYCPADHPTDDFILWLGKEPPYRFQGVFGKMPIQRLNSQNPLQQVQNAFAVAYLDQSHDPCIATWLARALACGTPIISWEHPALKALFARPELGITVPPGDLQQLVVGMKTLLPRREQAAIRRDYAFGMFGHRAAAARYRELYKSLLEDQ